MVEDKKISNFDWKKLPWVKNWHDKVAAKDHGVGDDNHGGEAEVDEASDELVEEGDDEEESEDGAGEDHDPGLYLLGSKSGRYGQRKDGKRNDDWRDVRLQASYLLYKWSIASWICYLQRIGNQTHLAQPCLKHDKHDGRPNEDAKDGSTDLVGGVNQVI